MKYIFIVNPVAGLMDKTEQIREEVAKRTDIDAIIFNTEEAGHESILMKEMLDIFDDEDVRICVCGGSGTLSNTLDAIDVQDMDHVEVAFYPCGLTNDFLKNFGDHGHKFEKINQVLDSKTRHVDYMRCIVDGDEKNVRNELLFVTMGVAANIEKASQMIRFLGGLSPSIMYTIATVLTIPFSPAIDYEVIIDGVDYSREYKLIYVGNSLCMGGGFIPIKSDITCTDGYINVLLLKRIPMINVLTYLKEFMHGELSLKHAADASVIKCKEIYVRRKDGKMTNVNADGEIFSNNSWHIKVVDNRLKFVVPNDAAFLEDASELMECLGLC